MTRPTILDMDLVVVPTAPDNEMLAAVWSVRMSNGKAVAEVCYESMLSASPYPTAWDDVRRYVEGLETQLKAHMADDYGCGPAGMSKADVDRTIAHNATVRAEAAEARIAELEKRLADAEMVIEPFADGRAKITHANGCRYHGGHDCDCGKDDYLRAARAYMEGK